MVALTRFQSLNPRIAAIGGAAAASVVAAIVALMPTHMLEDLVWTSGVAALVPAAQPPLGLTARAVLAIAAGGLTGVVGWSILYLLVGPGGFLVAAVKGTASAPIAVRRADAHPDAPPRRPISAADLGTPPGPAAWMEQPGRAPRIERPLPVDLEQPLAAFDPDAIPAAPRMPVRPVAPLPRPQNDARIETFALPPIPTPSAPPPTEPVAPPSIEALLRRLEQGARSRVAAH